MTYGHLRLTVCTPESAAGSTLGIEYGKPLLLPCRSCQVLVVRQMTASCGGTVTGLRSEYVLASSVARSAPVVRADLQQDPDPRSRRLGFLLDPGHVLPQREARVVSPGHDKEPDAEAELQRTSVVRHQVGLVGVAARACSRVVSGIVQVLM